VRGDEESLAFAPMPFLSLPDSICLLSPHFVDPQLHGGVRCGLCRLGRRCEYVGMHIAGCRRCVGVRAGEHFHVDVRSARRNNIRRVNQMQILLA